MRTYEFSIADAHLTALPSGALWWSQIGILCVSDLHFGKSQRIARRGGALLTPHGNRETLSRLETDILTRNPRTIICLGDSFDDLAVQEEMEPSDHRWLTCLMAGRTWIWIAGTHDAGPVDIGGSHLQGYESGPLTFRHIADPDAKAEISGHFHPRTSVTKKGQTANRPCFLLDDRRLVLPAYGRYTGGLRSDAPVLQNLMAPGALAILTGKKAQPVPMRL